MLELKNIKKSYKTGDFVQDALKGVNLKFDSNEFVSILGSSGSGKTTLLNIIGGLDRYDSGDLVINNKSTKKFDDTLWDAYRNNCIGFIFQSYNLIGHLSILENVEMSLTLSGVDGKSRKKRSLEALDKVGLLLHKDKKPSQLSGGQMQRVAIARALVNNPEIILADEPTGALDTKTSKEIMDLIKEVCKDKLIIMVTHNPELAKTYSTRIIELKDGEIISDSKPEIDKEDETHITIKKTKMNLKTALKLSFNNIKTKKGRTLLTAFASSIGIIGIALILSLSNGLDKQIDKYENNTLSSFPIMVSRLSMDMDEDQIEEISGSFMPGKDDYPDEKVIYPFDIESLNVTHENNITNEYIEYVENIDSSLINGISYYRSTNLNLLVKTNEIKNINASNLNMSSIPKEESDNFVNEAFDILEGRNIESYDELLLVVDNKNRVDKNILELLNIDTTKEEIDLKEVIGKEIKLVLNNEYYTKYSNMYIPSTIDENLYNNTNNITLKIVGVVRCKEDNYLGQIVTSMSSMTSMSSGTTSTTSIGNILYKNELIEKVIEINSNSNIVNYIKTNKVSPFTGEALDEETLNSTLYYLGSEDYPYVIYIYPKDFDAKDEILDYLDKYNKNLKEEDKIVYTDLAKTVSSLSSNIMDAVTIVLVSFSGVSLVVSSIMIGIITYISVLERTKEIGILRSLGARKKDIRRVFNSETFIIGITSGLLGIIIARLMLIPINMILYNLTNIKGIAVLDPVDALILITVSTILTLIGGSIPARMASKKDPVEALRTE